jgi:biopolymer transport protein ExbD
MSYIPDDEIKGRISLNLAPMIDFLFLLLMFFATLAVTRITTKDTDIQLVEAKPETQASALTSDSDFKIINISINPDGKYKWVTEIRDHPMDNPEEIKDELLRQYEKGLLPEDKLQTQVMLKIDKNAKWEPILKAILAVREAGFEVRPVYEPEEKEG